MGVLLIVSFNHYPSTDQGPAINYAANKEHENDLCVTTHRILRLWFATGPAVAAAVVFGLLVENLQYNLVSIRRESRRNHPRPQPKPSPAVSAQEQDCPEVALGNKLKNQSLSNSVQMISMG